MNRDPYADMFRFQIGECVRWAQYPRDRFWIGQRRWTERDLFAPLVEYHLLMGERTRQFVGWAYDADLMLWDDDEPSAR